MSPEFFIKAFQLLLSLSILIVLHELGHFIPAKLFGTRVEKFYLFFDVKYSLFKKKIGETVYGIGWLPLGGYVKISGMIDESFDKEQMQKPPQPWEFRSKPAWQRLIIMLGGVTVNLLLGFFIYMMVLFVWGKETLPQENIPLGLEPTALIQEIGFEKGDKILDVDGKKLDYVLDINKMLLLRPVEKIKVEKLDGSISEINIPENIGNDIFQSGQINSFIPLFSATIDSILIDSPALYSGMQSGDKIVSINNEIIYDYASFKNWLDNNPMILLMLWLKETALIILYQLIEMMMVQ
jgi:regulator of sigma E protease